MEMKSKSNNLSNAVEIAIIELGAGIDEAGYPLSMRVLEAADLWMRCDIDIASVAVMSTLAVDKRQTSHVDLSWMPAESSAAVLLLWEAVRVPCDESFFAVCSNDIAAAIVEADLQVRGEDSLFLGIGMWAKRVAPVNIYLSGRKTDADIINSGADLKYTFSPVYSKMSE